MELQLLRSGKVRDVYSDTPGEVILVATDRVSVYDVVLPTPIPDKGRLLTALSLWWFERLDFPNHLLSVPSGWEGRAIRCRELDMIPVECIARGYVEGDRLSEPVFTPTTKVGGLEYGHDESMTFEEVVDRVGARLATRLRAATLELYRQGAKIAESRGLTLVDTKFEFGLTPEGELMLADEVLTGDSSRYWRGESRVALDKQFLRDWVTHLGWNRKPPGPEVPAGVVQEMRRRYTRLYETLASNLPR